MNIVAKKKVDYSATILQLFFRNGMGASIRKEYHADDYTVEMLIGDAFSSEAVPNGVISKLSLSEATSLVKDIKNLPIH